MGSFHRHAPGCLRGLGLGLLICLVAGCDQGPGLHPVAGRVSFGDQPLAAGDVVFFPDDGARTAGADTPQGKIDANGAYQLATAGRPGAPAGRYRVTVVAQTHTRPANQPANPHNVYPLIPQKYFSSDTTPLRVEVVASPEPGRYDLKVAR